MFIVLWRNTTSETMAPGPFFYIDYNLAYLLFIIICSLICSHFNLNTLDTFNSLAVNKRIKRIECIEIKSKTKQRASDHEKQVNEVVINVKEWTGGHSFTSGVSPYNGKRVG